MRALDGAVKRILKARVESGKPLAIIVAGHNGSGKSTLWYRQLAPKIRIPLINADRLMMSVLPEVGAQGRLPAWASELRDNDQSWMHVAREGVAAFVAQALLKKVPFAMETVFSHWRELPSGRIESKIDQIKQMQTEGYFVVLIFVGLTDVRLSILRVETRVALGGHTVPEAKLIARFPRTQDVAKLATDVADASLLVDNSRGEEEAFTVCHVRLGQEALFDIRDGGSVPPAILTWLDRVRPRV